MALLKQWLQDEFELAAFMELLKREGVRSYLEIGSHAGGTLRWIATALERPSTFVAVDHAADAERKVLLTQAINYLNAMGHHATVIWGDSTADGTVAAARARGPYDCVFIDGNHTLPFVAKDWDHYSPMGRLVCFHDIAWARAPQWNGQRIDVPQFWDAVKAQYRHQEIKCDPTLKNNGIGVIWRQT